MAARIVAAARQAASITRISSQQPFPHLVQRRGLAGAADHHGPPKVNCWQEPMNPGSWKEEQFVIVSLSGWGLLIFGGYKFFAGGKDKKEKVAEASH
ncbi:uncharacterized protein LOC130806738 isoform X1 [Amaranthus tricolor]|uniref:uncharacterized protein LOC130806733 isoform X1 n=1 Tax=Amaranthus tricolor TaxID=29722 RepID=UPI00258400A3|nr:uncharacterized protein LOC130806733 isoform X1 [Amaranthus tricolor]XP_057527916.1 uncharacterized protein LOC130806738 isoform X1 [Amaranthus tricolor]